MATKVVIIPVNVVFLRNFILKLISVASLPLQQGNFEHRPGYGGASWAFGLRAKEDDT